MRVAIVTESFLPTRNGVTTSVCRVTEELTARDHEVAIVAPGPAPQEFAGAEVHALRTVSVRQFPTGLPTYRVEAVLAELDPDVVHLASPFAVGARGVYAAARLGLPTVAVYQTDMPSYLAQHAPGVVGASAGRTAWHWIRLLHNRVDRTLAPSRPTVAELHRHGINRVHLWGRGVDTRRYTPHRRQSPAVTALRRRVAPDGGTIVGYVGRLAPEKEVDRLIEVARVPGVRLLVVGDGPSRPALERLLPEAVFVGFLDGAALADAYAACDVFVHTGTRETFGQTLQEAAASGLPVIAPAAGGPLDLVRPGETGYLFAPDRPGALSACVGALVAEPLQRARMGAAGRRMVADRSWGSLTEDLLEHYRAARARAYGLQPA
ncbi:MAG TPA: glycosyltransferase family 1 protein [Intrasporangiaceae bacterium]|nr:glycosyltransferase family 1 protein [Intrasporangiaceae bacterium]